MEHEVFVPVPAESLRRVLADPARVARCVPGFQQDADGESGPLSGRLKVRVGGHTITYRGTLRITAQDGGFAIEGEGAEARGTGSVKLSLTLRLTESDGRTTLHFTGTARGDGRLSELDDTSALASAQRLLDRFADRLGAEPGEEPGEGAATLSVFETEIPPPSLGAPAEAEFEQGDAPLETPETPETPDETPLETSGEPPLDTPGETPLDTPGETPLERLGGVGRDAPLDSPLDVPLDREPAEAAHARRTMIGRSAEEVDHAPPRGRYAPVPPPASATASATLRWAAPAAALALASAVVVGRALRRRR
jgi:carbon monoxide dehydrogenase subunit G